MKITPEQLEHIKNNVEAGLRAVGIEVEAVESPQDGDAYYYQWVTGHVDRDRWRNHSIDHARKRIGNVGRTEAEAEQIRDACAEDIKTVISGGWYLGK